MPPDAMIDWYTDTLRGEDTIDGRALRAYLHSMELHLHEAYRLLRAGGTAS